MLCSSPLTLCLGLVSIYVAYAAPSSDPYRTRRSLINYHGKLKTRAMRLPTTDLPEIDAQTFQTRRSRHLPAVHARYLIKVLSLLRS